MNLRKLLIGCFRIKINVSQRGRINIMDLPWKDDLYHLLNNKKRAIHYRNSSSASRRVQGQYGSDRKFYGYRTIILYFQLSPNYTIDRNKFNIIFNLFSNFTDTGKSGVSRFLPVYFNDENGDLIAKHSLVNNIHFIMEKRDEFFSENAKANHKYSQKINYLSPPVYMPGEKEFPSHKDLCVFIYEENTLTATDKVIKELDWMSNNSIWISIKNDKINSISDEIPKA